MGNDRLHLSTGESRYTKFRVVLQGSLRLSWQDLSANQANKMTASFDTDVKAFVGEYFASTARDDQLEYMRTAFKPYNMSMLALAARICVISRLARFLPGSWVAGNPMTRTPLYEDDMQYKRALFSMVPMG